MAVGNEGHCKICAHVEAPRFIRGAREGGKSGEGWNATEAMEAGAAFGLKFSRQTWYEHQKHVRAGETAVVPVKSAALTASDIKRTSNEDFLGTIRDIGMQKALANPESVTVDQALKAVQIMEGKKERPNDGLNILVQFVTGQPPAVVIEGSAARVPEEIK